MEDSVIRAMARWPNVPVLSGWMRLDEHGRWWIAGELVRNPNSLAFIARNYHCDAQGRWFFQNGPQRVFVELAYTPWIFSLGADGLVTQTGQPAGEPLAGFVDEDERLVLLCPIGPGLVKDLLEVSERYLRAAEKGWVLLSSRGELALEHEKRAALAKRLGFIQN